MGKGSFIGEFEQMVLLGTLRLGDDAYGVTIHQEVEETTRRPIKRGAIYVALQRLERKGMLTSAFGEPTATRGGRAKRFYTVSASGRSALRASRESLLRLWSGIEPELEKA